MDIFFVQAAACLSAAIAVGIGVLGPSLGQGIIGSKACENIGKYPESANKINQAMLTSMAMVESSSLWCVLIAGGLLILAYRLG
jgi:F-type H+-transporting ATPase subunit c